MDKTLAIQKVQKYKTKLEELGNGNQVKKELYTKKFEHWYNVLVGGGLFKFRKFTKKQIGKFEYLMKKYPEFDKNINELMKIFDEAKNQKILETYNTNIEYEKDIQLQELASKNRSDNQNNPNNSPESIPITPITIEKSDPKRFIKMVNKSKREFSMRRR